MILPHLSSMAAFFKSKVHLKGFFSSTSYLMLLIKIIILLFHDFIALYRCFHENTLQGLYYLSSSPIKLNFLRPYRILKSLYIHFIQHINLLICETDFLTFTWTKASFFFLFLSFRLENQRLALLNDLIRVSCPVTCKLVFFDTQLLILPTMS